MSGNAHRSSEEIEALLRSTRERLANDLDELSRRVREKRNSIPVWLAGLGLGGALLLLRRPLVRALGSVVPVAAPIVVTWLLERAAKRAKPASSGAPDRRLR